jgi:hypothetical protein
MALPMHGFRAAVVLLLSLLAANAVLGLVLIHNQAAGIYPPDADSLSLPFIGTALFSLLIYGVIGAALLLPRTGHRWIIVRSILAALSTLLSLVQAGSWTYSNHYPVSLAFLGVSSLCVWALIAGWKVQK